MCQGWLVAVEIAKLFSACVSQFFYKLFTPA